MAKRKGLGRGLDALLGGVPTQSLDETPAESSSVRLLPVDLIERGRYQPRTQMDDEALEALAASIREQGVLQPIVVRAIADGRYEIVAGERRWRAAQRAALAEVPVVVRDVADRDALAIALIENIQREDLNPIEEARALDRLIREFDLTHAAAAEAVGRSRAGVTNLLRLLELDETVRDLLESGALEMGHARALLAVSTSRQAETAREVIRRSLNVRQTEALVRRSTRAPAGGASARAQDPDVRRLERSLRESLGARVELKQKRGGRGSLVIHYASLDELDGLLERIQRKPEHAER